MEERGTQTQPREGSLSSDFMKTPGSAPPDAPRSSPQSWGSPTWNTALQVLSKSPTPTSTSHSQASLSPPWPLSTQPVTGVPSAPVDRDYAQQFCPVDQHPHQAVTTGPAQ